MNLPFFYTEEYVPGVKEITLAEETSRHIIQVLRMKKTDQVLLTDGKGNKIVCEIIDDHKKHCRVALISADFTARSSRKISIAISLLKNASRFEWFLEKATEIGVGEIIPMICERTEKEKIKQERIKNILVSSMLQSQQCWLPEMGALTTFTEVVNEAQQDQKFIAHCLDGKKGSLSDLANNSLRSQLILIGPEGDFTGEEIAFAITHHFLPVSLGDNRLRSETAGIAAVLLLHI
ncbi:MAG TPA: RsmE family RNA methyltransferase [Chitinophagaceae bacterium]|nr:RsmE family RNA methyltransferase [Chitinophagaceae bacterium]